MASRKSFLIFFNYDEKWIGGAYYLLNLIKGLTLLPAKQQPLIYVCISQEREKQFLKETGYKNIIIKKTSPAYSKPEKVVNRISRIILSRNIIVKDINKKINKLPVNTCFINYYQLSHVINLGFPISKIFCWIPDLQDRVLPNFFSEQEIEERAGYYKLAIDTKVRLLFSSKSSAIDFVHSFGETENTKVIVPFAVFHTSFENLDIEHLKRKYDIPAKYFIISNQFWKHKNHLVIINAANTIKNILKENLVKFIFTGKEYDYRNPDYLNELKELIKSNGLDTYFSFLGLIPRNEQLKLMSHSIAVIQPSLFEGWSTVVEDAKAMNQLLILSNIDVHQEQANENCIFFDPNNPAQLALIIKQQLKNRQSVKRIDYSLNKKKFAEKFYQNI